MTTIFRDVQRYAQALGGSPDLLKAAELIRKGDSPVTGRIGTWDEIPDTMSLVSPKIEWVSEGLIPRGSLTLIAGEPGSYKSWLALSLLRAVSTGGGFLGRSCAASDILYLDRENPLPVVRERLAMLGLESLVRTKVWGNWMPDAPPAIGDERLVQMANERRPVMIFDSLIRFHNAEENSATEMARIMGDLRTLANAGATIVSLHHRGKSEASRYRGSSDIVGGVDTAFAVSRDRQAGVLKLECFKSRFLEEFAITIRPDFSGVGDFVVIDSPEEVEAEQDAHVLAEHIRKSPGQSQSHLLGVSGIPQGRARGILERFDGRRWTSVRGPHNSKRFFPIESPPTVEIDV